LARPWIRRSLVTGNNPPKLGIRDSRACFKHPISTRLPLELQLEAGSNLSVAMTAAIERLKSEGWRTEGTPEFGFVFIRKANDRWLLMLTARDPYSCELQSFSPYKR